MFMCIKWAVWVQRGRQAPILESRPPGSRAARQAEQGRDAGRQASGSLVGPDQGGMEADPGPTTRSRDGRCSAGPDTGWLSGAMARRTRLDSVAEETILIGSGAATKTILIGFVAATKTCTQGFGADSKTCTQGFER